MKSIILSTIFLVENVRAFQPSMVKKTFVPYSSKSMDVDFYNPSREIDLEHAHDCAEHFGKCSIQDLEEMRTGKDGILPKVD